MEVIAVGCGEGRQRVRFRGDAGEVVGGDAGEEVTGSRSGSGVA